MENFAQLEYVMLLLIGSILLAVGLALISIKIAPDVGLMDIPGSAGHKKHLNPVPLTGGCRLIGYDDSHDHFNKDVGYP